MRTGIGGASEFRIQRRQRRGRFLDGLFVGRRGGLREQRLGIRRLLVHRNAHVVNGVDDVFDLLRIDDLGGQVIVDLRVGEVPLALAARDQELQLRLPVLGHDGRTADAERAFVERAFVERAFVERVLRRRLRLRGARVLGSLAVSGAGARAERYFLRSRAA